MSQLPRQDHGDPSDGLGISERIPAALYVLRRSPQGGLALPFVSRRLLVRLALEREALMQRPRLALRALHPAERRDFLRRHERCLASGEPFLWEGRLLVNGSVGWVRVEAEPGAAPHGEQLWEGVVQDIRAPVQMVAELQEARDALARTALAITEAIPVGTYTMVQPPDGGLAFFSFLSDRFLEITGLDRDEARRDPLKGFACVHPDDYDDWVRKNVEVFEQKLPFFGECRVIVKGEVRWITAESVPRGLPDGSTVWEGVLIDVTERVRVQQRLEASRRNLQRILEHLPIPLGSYRLDGSGEVVFLNRRFTASFGYGSADIPTLEAWYAKAYPDSAYRAEVMQRWQEMLRQDAAGDQDVASQEFRITRLDGTQSDVQISGVVIDDQLLGSFIDVTEQRRAERALEQARQRERRREEERRRELEHKLKTSLAAAAVAHEINQPLSALLLQAKLFLAGLEQQEGAPSSGDVRGFVQEQVAQADRVVLTIEKMRALLRNVQTAHGPVELVNLIDSVLLYLRQRIETQRVTLGRRGLERPCLVEGDADQLQIAISNLLRNALEAMAAPGLAESSRQPQLLVMLEVGPRQVELVVADSGPGFDADALKRLPLGSNKPQGTGIGLFVVQTTAENHGGSLSFGVSALGGAEVRLSLPLLEPDQDSMV